MLDGLALLAVDQDPLDPPGLTIHPPVISVEEPAVVKAKIEGGLDGEFFSLTCACSTAQQAILACIGRIKVSSYKD